MYHLNANLTQLGLSMHGLVAAESVHRPSLVYQVNHAGL